MTDILVRYARDYLLKHFVVLSNLRSHIPLSDQTVVSRALVNFLSDPYHLAQDEDRSFSGGEYWLADAETRESVKSWLQSTSSGLQFSGKHRIKPVLEPSESQLGFLKGLARSVGRKWVTHRKENAAERYFNDGP